jgi:hypothetical protein
MIKNVIENFDSIDGNMMWNACHNFITHLTSLFFLRYSFQHGSKINISLLFKTFQEVCPQHQAWSLVDNLAYTYSECVNCFKLHWEMRACNY